MAVRKARQEESLVDIPNSEISNVIDEWIKGERNRCILKRRLIDEICFERLAEEFQLSTNQVKNIVYKQQEIFFRHLDKHIKK